MSASGACANAVLWGSAARCRSRPSQGGSMLRAVPMLLAALFVPAASTLAQTGASSPSPTLPSDTLEANYAPRSAAGPMPELAPSLPSDTLDATQPVDSFPTDPFVDEHLVPQDGD